MEFSEGDCHVNWGSRNGLQGLDGSIEAKGVEKVG